MSENLCPSYIMLCGLPGGGKTHFRKNFEHEWGIFVDDHVGNLMVLSTDDTIDRVADSVNGTYSEVFRFAAPFAEKVMNAQRRVALAGRWNILHDQTNLTPGTRRRKMAEVPRGYRRFAVVFDVDEAVRQERLASRPGKVIPPEVDANMVATWEPPTLNEGFEAIFQATEKHKLFEAINRASRIVSA